MRKPTMTQGMRERARNIEQSKVTSVQADPLEIVIARAAAAGAPIQMDGAPPMYTDEDHPSRPYTDIRTDRFELAKQLWEQGETEGSQNAMEERDAEGGGSDT